MVEYPPTPPRHAAAEILGLYASRVVCLAENDGLHGLLNAHRVACLAENEGLHGLLIARALAEELHLFPSWYPRYINSPSLYFRSHQAVASTTCLFCIICSFVGIISVNLFAGIISVNLFAGIIFFFIFSRWFALNDPRAAPTDILRLHLTPEAVHRPDAVPQPHD